MLQFLRTRMKTILWVTVFAFVGTIFLSWGMGGAARKSVSRVAVVNGEAISPQEYYKRLQQVQQYWSQMLGDNYTDELAKQLNIEKQVMEGLIKDKIMEQKAREMGLRVTNGEIIAKIKTFPEFQTAKKFDAAKYNAAIKTPRNSRIWPSIEADLRKQLLREKLELLVKDSAVATEAETRVLFDQKNDKLQFSYLRVKPSDLVNRDKVARYFDEHTDELKTPERVQASHILFSLEDDDAEETLKKAREVRTELLAGADFAELARKYSADPGSAPTGGGLGFFPRGQMVPEFDEAAFSLAVGEISQPVKTKFGYHLIKVTGHEPARLQPLKDIYEEVAARVVSDEEKNKAKDLLAKVRMKVTEVGTLKDAAAAFNLPVSVSDEVKWQDKINEELPWQEKLWLTAAGLGINQVSEPIPIDGDFYLLQLKKRLKGEEKEYQKQKQGLKEEILNAKLDDLLNNWYDSLRSKAEVDVLLQNYQDAVKAYSG